MNWRWYITGLIIALAFCGVGMEQSTTNPNQEIVVRFNTNSITANDAKVAISEITTRLKAIGVEDVQVSDVFDGKVKVTYYSTLDVAVIKNLLNKQHKLELGDAAFNERDDSSKFPFSSDSNTYKLEVIKIQKDPGSDIGFQGILVEAKSFSDQYLKPKVSIPASEIDFNPKEDIESIGFSTYSKITILTDNITHKIPQVRAGPIC